MPSGKFFYSVVSLKTIWRRKFRSLPVKNSNLETFFSFSDVKIEEDGGIPVEVFLLASQGIIPVLDKIGSKAFAPVKIDFLGNILVSLLLGL